MKGNGFTLIELLAVIVILAIILLIAVPQVLDVIEDVKNNAYISTNELVVDAAELYMASYVDKLPNEDETFVLELSSDLQDGGFIDEVSSKDNTCSGYVTVTKVEDDNFLYIPHINCSETVVTNPTDDGLVVHYTFDDFEESTTNYIDNSYLKDGVFHKPYSSVSRGEVAFVEGDSPLGGLVIKHIANNNDSYFYDYLDLSDSIVEASSGEKYTFSVYVKSETPNIPVQIWIFPLLSDGTFINAVNPIEFASTSWSRVEVTHDMPEGTVGIAVRVDNEGGAGAVVYWDGFQLEKKDHMTPFVQGERIDSVNDYSGNNNNAELNLTTTPEWKEENGNGFYSFDNDQRFLFPLTMNNTNYGLSDATYTFSLWLRLKEHSLEGNQVLMGSSYYNGFGIYLVSDGFTYTRIGGYFRNSTSSKGLLDYYMEIDKWVNVTVVMDKPKSLLLVYIDGELFQTATITFDEFTYYDKPFGLNLTNHPSGNPPWATIKADMDEATIYERALSPEEIKQKYLVEKEKIL